MESIKVKLNDPFEIIIQDKHGNDVVSQIYAFDGSTLTIQRGKIHSDLYPMPKYVTDKLIKKAELDDFAITE